MRESVWTKRCAYCAQPLRMLLHDALVPMSLHMPACRVLEPEVFSSLFRLQELRLDDNAIRNINPPVTVNGGMAACFPHLRVLQLSNNRLLDPSDCINRVAGIPTLTELSVTGNPFARKHQVRRALLCFLSAWSCLHDLYCHS